MPQRYNHLAKTDYPVSGWEPDLQEVVVAEWKPIQNQSDVNLVICHYEDDGWELVTVTCVATGYTDMVGVPTMKWCVYFKRPVESELEEKD